MSNSTDIQQPSQTDSQGITRTKVNTIDSSIPFTGVHFSVHPRSWQISSQLSLTSLSLFNVVYSNNCQEKCSGANTPQRQKSTCCALGSASGLTARQLCNSTVLNESRRLRASYSAELYSLHTVILSPGYRVGPRQLCHPPVALTLMYSTFKRSSPGLSEELIK